MNQKERVFFLLSFKKKQGNRHNTHRLLLNFTLRVEYTEN